MLENASFCLSMGSTRQSEHWDDDEMEDSFKGEFCLSFEINADTDEGTLI